MPAPADLAFPKPTHYVDPASLRAYCGLHPRCEVQGCKQRPAPEPHHLIPRARGRDDRHDNLLRLCVSHHLAYHRLGGKRWLAEYQDRLEPDALGKVRTALRLA